jgi:hypothetical protein
MRTLLLDIHNEWDGKKNFFQNSSFGVEFWQGKMIEKWIDKLKLS